MQAADAITGLVVVATEFTAVVVADSTGVVVAIGRTTGTVEDARRIFLELKPLPAAAA